MRPVGNLTGNRWKLFDHRWSPVITDDHRSGVISSSDSGQATGSHALTVSAAPAASSSWQRCGRSLKFLTSIRPKYLKSNLNQIINSRHSLSILESHSRSLETTRYGEIWWYLISCDIPVHTLSIPFNAPLPVILWHIYTYFPYWQADSFDSRKLMPVTPQPHTHLGVLHLVQSMYLSVHLQTRHGKVSMTKDTLGWQAADLKQTSQHQHKAVVRRSLEYANHRKSISNVS